LWKIDDREIPGNSLGGFTTNLAINFVVSNFLNAAQKTIGPINKILVLP
jgi:hypothetical protein